MLSVSEIKEIGSELQVLNPNYKYGYAGSYARGTAKKSSDLDIVIDGAKDISLDDYMVLYNKITSLLSGKKVKFDMLILDSLKLEDEELDALAVKEGLGIIEESVYKTIVRDVIWFE